MRPPIGTDKKGISMTDAEFFGILDDHLRKPLPRPDEPMQVVTMYRFQKPPRVFDVAELVVRFGKEATMGMDSPKRQEFRSLHQWSKGGINMSDSRAMELGL